MGRQSKRPKQGRGRARREEQRLAQGSGHGRGRPRALAFWGISVGTLAVAAYFIVPALGGGRVSTGDPGVIELDADMVGFSQSVIRVKAGEPVTIRLTSLDSPFHIDGGGRHQFAVDELGVNIIAESKSTSSGTFTPERAGTYVFYCDICCGGRANPAMNGRLIVEA